MRRIRSVFFQPSCLPSLPTKLATLRQKTVRIENGIQTILKSFGNLLASTAAEQFDNGAFPGARIYDRRYPVIDEETGTVLSMIHFGKTRI